MISKYNKLIKNNEPTEKNKQKLHDELQLPLNLTNRYFKRVCVKCGKKLDLSEVSMFLKIYGRYDNIENDTRDYYCHQHLAEELNWSIEKYGKTLEKVISSKCPLMNFYNEGFFDNN